MELKDLVEQMQKNVVAMRCLVEADINYETARVMFVQQHKITLLAATDLLNMLEATTKIKLRRD